jgi:hypothetical protein
MHLLRGFPFCVFLIGDDSCVLRKLREVDRGLKASAKGYDRSIPGPTFDLVEANSDSARFELLVDPIA